MIPEKDIEIGSYKYDLPESRIARYPLPERDMSKMLVYRGGEISDDIFRNLPDYVDSDSLLVFNKTKVIRARLKFTKRTGAAIEIFCLEPFSPSDHNISFSSTMPVEWKCLVGNLKKWKSGSLEMQLTDGSKQIILSAELVSHTDDGVIIRFSWNEKNLCFSEILELSGHIPVPPYLNRDDEEIDNTRYQTIYSSCEGSVAAPTAGLHFTTDLLKRLNNKGIAREEITLHVGAGTFIPVKSETIGGHSMHTEHFLAGRATIENLRGKKIIAVGTTTVRTLESLYWLGAMILGKDIEPDAKPEVSQWTPYNYRGLDYSSDEALDALLAYMDLYKLDNIEASTSIIIVPGYRFRVVSGLITNWHMPGSTLLLLVSALIGERWRDIYDHAIKNDYRFLSYGDSSLLLPD